MLYDSLRWWQIALSVLWLSLGLAGLLGLLRQPRHSKTPFRRRLLICASAMAVALVGFWLTRDLLQPAARPITPPPTEVDAHHFDSRDDPTLRVEAPDGYRLEFDQKTRTIRVIRGESAFEVAPVSLQIDSAHLQETIDSQKLLSLIADKLTQAGLKVDPLTEVTVNGLSAQSLTGRIDKRAITTLLVKRNPHYLTTLQCMTNDGLDSATACDPIIKTLIWRVPVYH